MNKEGQSLVDMLSNHNQNLTIAIQYHGNGDTYLAMAPHFFSKYVCLWYGVASEVCVAYCSPHGKVLKAFNQFKPAPDNRTIFLRGDATEQK